MPERFVSACALYIIRALSKIHKEGIIHCELDLENVLVYLTPFGGDAFMLDNFDNARLQGCDIPPVFQNEKQKLLP